MLVLSRKLDESMVIAGDIKVTVVDIRRGRVRLGIEAPPAVSIQRSELLVPPAEREVCLSAAAKPAIACP